MAVRHLSSRLVSQLHRPGTSRAAGFGAPSTLQLVAWLSSNARSLEDAVEVAKALRTNEFLTNELAALRGTRSAISHAELVEFMQHRGFTPGAAADVVARLEKSGAVLNLSGTILLRPGEVAEALARVLPSSLDAARERLHGAQQELALLDAQQAKIGRHAVWRQHGLVWGGLGSQLALWGLLFRLTYYELSWDVMEPICFFVGGGQALVCYAFFMLTRTEFTWDVALKRFVGRWEATQLQRAGFDMQCYARLKREVQRLGELVQAVQQQQPKVEAEVAAAGVEGKKGA